MPDVLSLADAIGTEIDGVYVVQPTLHGDERGLFIETYRRQWFPNSREMIQSNRSRFDLLLLCIAAKPHYRSLAKCFFNLAQRHVQRFLFVHTHLNVFYHFNRIFSKDSFKYHRYSNANIGCCVIKIWFLFNYIIFTQIDIVFVFFH